MRFHVIGLPHTQTTKEYVICAFTEKVRRFCIMMKDLGHTVYLYASEENEAPCDELITCITKEQQQESLAGKHFTEAEFNNELPHWQIFNGKAIEEIGKRIQEKDFICVIGGASHKPIADAFPDYMTVEFGIGYAGTFAKYRVFESYAWMHSIYSAFANPALVDGNFYDAVIPGYIEPEMFPLQEKKEDYYLYVGRMVDRKGIGIAQHVCKEMGLKLIMAGPGKDPKIEYGEWVGPVGAEERAKLMGGAIALFAPTLYIEPFGNIVIEAQMCGTPTITTDWGAFTETNPQGITGYRCRNAMEFAIATEWVKDLDPVAIHKRAVATYSLDAIAPQYEQYFGRLLTLWGDGWYERK